MKNFRDISLRYKFLALIAVMLSASILLYLVLAIRLFEQDKTAFVYQGQGTLAGTLSDQSYRDLHAYVKTLKLLTVVYGQSYKNENERQSTLKSVLKPEASILEFSLFEQHEPLVSIRQGGRLTFYGVEEDSYFSNLRTTFPFDFSQADREKINFKNVSLENGPPLLRISFRLPENSINNLPIYAFAHVDITEQIKTLRRSEESISYIVDSLGRVVIHRNESEVLGHRVLGEVNFLTDILNSVTKSGSKEIRSDAGHDLIVSFAKLPIGGLTVINEIEKDKAFLATTRLKEKSVYVALLILSISFMTSLLFTKRLTSALQVLFDATTKIAKGDFNVDVRVLNGDEIGSLSRSFNSMARRIVELLKETADKARMEKELETAHLVQENFFPVKSIKMGDVEVSTFFKSATECGGDWWGHIVRKDESISLLIGDATGHGVPAALITAAAHACCMTIQQISQQSNERFGPARILKTLNNTIFEAGKGRVKMTFFVAEINLKNGHMRYANAAHEWPIMSRSIDDLAVERDKSTIDALTGEPGFILGDKPNLEFQEHEFQLNYGDVVVWYTDGLTECRNEEGEEYGENRLIRSFVKTAHLEPEKVCDELIKKANKFFGTQLLDDDITLLVMRYAGQAKPQTSSIRNAS